MMTRDDVLQRLRNNSMYKLALSSVSPDQAKKISEMTEGYLMRAIDNLMPLFEQVNDEEILSAAQKELNVDGRLITNLSGTKDD